MGEERRRVELVIRDISFVASLKFWLAQLVSMFILIIIGVIIYAVIFIALLSQIISTFPHPLTASPQLF